MRTLILYIHGKGGSGAECEHYRPLFRNCDILGLDYQASAPWEAGKEIREAVKRQKGAYERIILIANSIGAYFSMLARIDDMIHKAYFISPVVNLESLILDMMARAHVTEEDLRIKGEILTDLGSCCPGNISAAFGRTPSGGP